MAKRKRKEKNKKLTFSGHSFDTGDIQTNDGAKTLMGCYFALK